MADNEMKFFNVKNISLRVVGFAGHLIPPTGVIRVLDDEKQINRKSISTDPFLDETDEDPTIEGDFDISLVPKQVELQEVEKQTGQETQVVKPAGKTAGNTATGKGWTKK